MDALSGETLYEKNSHAAFYPASTTKILTALLVIEAGDLDRTVIIQPEDTKVEPSAIGFRPGESYTRRELLYARVDVIAGPDGAPRLVELELTEPSLFFTHAPGSAARLAQRIVNRLGG